MDRVVGPRVRDELFGSLLVPWGHLQTLLNGFDDNDTREWYAARAVESGWSRGVLLDRLNAQLHLRHGAAPSNFPAVLDEDAVT